MNKGGLIYSIREMFSRAGGKKPKVYLYQWTFQKYIGNGEVDFRHGSTERNRPISSSKEYKEFSESIQEYTGLYGGVFTSLSLLNE